MSCNQTRSDPADHHQMPLFTIASMDVYIFFSISCMFTPCSFPRKHHTDFTHLSYCRFTVIRTAYTVFKVYHVRDIKFCSVCLSYCVVEYHELLSVSSFHVAVTIQHNVFYSIWY